MNNPGITFVATSVCIQLDQRLLWVVANVFSVALKLTEECEGRLGKLLKLSGSNESPSMQAPRSPTPITTMHWSHSWLEEVLIWLVRLTIYHLISTRKYLSCATLITISVRSDYWSTVAGLSEAASLMSWPSWLKGITGEPGNNYPQGGPAPAS